MANEDTDLPTSASGLEAEIEARRDHLAATIDELAARTKPKAIARNSAAGLTRRVRAVTHGDDGQLRVERLGALAGALVVLSGLLVWLRRRR